MILGKGLTKCMLRARMAPLPTWVEVVQQRSQAVYAALGTGRSKNRSSTHHSSTVNDQAARTLVPHVEQMIQER